MGHGRLARDERGIAIVEFALVLPFVLALLIGIVDFGLFFNDTISVRQGARDAVRTAATGKFGSDTSCSLTGFTGGSGSSAHKVFCMVKSRDDVRDTETHVRLVVGESGCSGATCYAVGKPITICEQYRFQTITGFTKALFGKTVTTRTVFRVEIKNPSGLASATESGFNGPVPCAAPLPVG